MDLEPHFFRCKEEVDLFLAFGEVYAGRKCESLKCPKPPVSLLLQQTPIAILLERITRINSVSTECTPDNFLRAALARQVSML